LLVSEYDTIEFRALELSAICDIEGGKFIQFRVPYGPGNGYDSGDTSENEQQWEATRPQTEQLALPQSL
jgi:hypothetical protein